MLQSTVINLLMEMTMDLVQDQFGGSLKKKPATFTSDPLRQERRTERRLLSGPVRQVLPPRHQGNNHCQNYHNHHHHHNDNDEDEAVDDVTASVRPDAPRLRLAIQPLRGQQSGVRRVG